VAMVGKEKGFSEKALLTRVARVTILHKKA